jgi:hypothetical protein
MSLFWRSATVAALLSLASGEAYTPKHEAGRCSIRGSCGSSSFFSPALPCPDNGLAREPEDDVRKQLVDICGPKWKTGPVCCEGDQVWFAHDLVLIHLLIFNSSIPYRRTSRGPTASYHHVRHAKRTFTTSSARLLALPISPYLSTSPRPKRTVIKQE